MDEPNFEEKTAILYRAGFLRHQDLYDHARVEARWQVYKTVQQKSVRSKKQERLPRDA